MLPPQNYSPAFSFRPNQLIWSSTVHFSRRRMPNYLRPTFPLSRSDTSFRLDRLLFTSFMDGNDLTSPYSPDLPYEILPLQKVIDKLGESSSDHLATGLSDEQAEYLLAEVGPNELPSKQKTSIWELWIQQFEDGLVKILVVVAVLSALFSASEAWDVLLDHAKDTTGVLEAFLSNEEIRLNVMQSFVEPGIIIAILFLNAAVGVWQDLSARSSLEALDKMQPKLATVLRDSNWVSEFDARLLVPGDVIRLRVGDSIPADARLTTLSSSTMNVDESSLTGESVSVSKLPGDEGLVDLDIESSNISVQSKGHTIPIQDQFSMIFSSSLVTRGSGEAIVVRTGINTQIGKIQSTLVEAQSETEERKTPLGDQLDEFGTKLSYIIGLICLAVWFASLPRFADSAFDTWVEGAIYYAKVSVALGVAAIPEGLPAVITLCLSLGTRRMAERNVIVRKLPSVETLGCTSVICCDKTGTLTANQMTGVSMVLLEYDKHTMDGGIDVAEHKIAGSSYDPSGSVDGIERDECNKLKDGAVRIACDVMSLCNDARLIGNDDFEAGNADSSPKFSIEGEPTEAALTVLVEKLGPYASDDEEKKPSVLAKQNNNYFKDDWERIATLEFDRQRKSMSTICINKDNKKCRLLCKGAPNMVLKRCTHAKLRDGTIVDLDQNLIDKIEESVFSIGNRALRCIGLAYKEDAPLANANFQDSTKHETIETGMTFLGMIAIRDPPRPHVSDSVDTCIQAGIRIIMITGDAKATAVAIAKDVHIFNDSDGSCNERAFEGREFFALKESEQLELLSTGNLVICRAEPKDKQQLVKILQSIGEIPSMTGDGVNDAPALQQASIGVAMGIAGTDVAKEASDMILVDDNFSSIVNAVEEGRCIYANMQAFINFLITCNIGEVIGVFLASILGLPQLLTPLQLLWVNLVTDGPPATALGFNPPDPDLMTRKPRSSSEEILTPSLLRRYMLGGLYIGIATLGVYASYFLDQGVSLQELSSWSSCTDSPICEVFADIHAPQTLALTTLVTTELLKALCTVSVSSSILVVGPQKNPWLLLGVAVPFALNLSIIYIPTMAANFGLIPLSGNDWLKVICWSLPIVFIEETMKFYESSKMKTNVTE